MCGGQEEIRHAHLLLKSTAAAGARVGKVMGGDGQGRGGRPMESAVELSSSLLCVYAFVCVSVYVCMCVCVCVCLCMCVCRPGLSTGPNP
jgi:hypothetical protein